MKNPFELLMELLRNQVFLSAALAWILAQGSKTVRESVKNGGFSWEILGNSGGMPSSHSATMTAMTVSCAIRYGLGSGIFAVALFLGLVVIYDAAGVRYQSGQEAEILNRIRDRDLKEGREPVQKEPLHVKRGHTVPEIAVGMAVGLAAALIVCCLIF